MRILVIDDNAEITSVIQQLLDIEGYLVATARDANDGYLAYLNFRPDLVITDIQMPRKNGFELIKEIREHDPDIITIYMTGHIDDFRSCLVEEKKRYQVDFWQNLQHEMSYLAWFLRT